MKKVFISIISVALIVLTLVSCGENFTCTCCEEAKNEKKYTYEGEDVCKSCYEGLTSGEIK